MEDKLVLNEVSADLKEEKKVDIFYLAYLICFSLYALIAVLEFVLAHLFTNYKMLFTIYLASITNTERDFPFYYFSPERFTTYILFIALLALTVFVIVIMILKNTLISSNPISVLTFGKFGRFTPFVTLISTGIMLIPLFQDCIDMEKHTITGVYKARYGAGFIMSFICLAGYSAIYYLSNKCEDGCILSFVFKKAYLSVSVGFHAMHVIYGIIYFTMFTMNGDNIEVKMRFASWIAMVVYAGLTGAGTWFFSDLALGLTGIVFEIGFTLFNFGFKPLKRDEEIKKLKVANIVTSMIMTVGLIAVMVLVILIKRNEIMK